MTPPASLVLIVAVRGIRVLDGRDELPLLSTAHLRLGRLLHGVFLHFLHPLDLRRDLFWNGLRLRARRYSV